MAFSPARDFEQTSSQYAYITDANGPNLNFGGANTQMYCFGFIKVESKPNQMLIMGKQFDNTNTGYQWDVRILATGEMMWVKAYGASSAVTLQETTVGVLTNGTAYFFEAGNDGTNCFIGVTPLSSGSRNPRNTIADSNSFRTSTGKFWCGTRAGIGGAPDSGAYYDGLLQCFGVILGNPTSGECDSIFNAGAGVVNSNKPTLSTATWVSFWNGDEASGADFVDAVSGYTLTQVNTVGTAAGMVVLPVTAAPKMMLLGVGLRLGLC